MEQIQSHFLQDIYRLKDGLILEVNKYKSDGNYGITSLAKVKKTKLKGIAKTYQLDEDLKVYPNKIIPKGRHVMGYHSVLPVDDPKEFRIELRSSGGTIFGDIDTHRKIYRNIEKILASYEK